MVKEPSTSKFITNTSCHCWVRCSKSRRRRALVEMAEPSPVRKLHRCGLIGQQHGREADGLGHQNGRQRQIGSLASTPSAPASRSHRSDWPCKPTRGIEESSEAGRGLEGARIDHANARQQPGERRHGARSRPTAAGRSATVRARAATGVPAIRGTVRKTSSAAAWRERPRCPRALPASLGAQRSAGRWRRSDPARSAARRVPAPGPWRR